MAEASSWAEICSQGRGGGGVGLVQKDVGMVVVAAVCVPGCAFTGTWQPRQALPCR